MWQLKAFLFRFDEIRHKSRSGDAMNYRFSQAELSLDYIIIISPFRLSVKNLLPYSQIVLGSGSRWADTLLRIKEEFLKHLYSCTTSSTPMTNNWIEWDSNGFGATPSVCPLRQVAARVSNEVFCLERNFDAWSISTCILIVFIETVGDACNTSNPTCLYFII